MQSSYTPEQEAQLTRWGCPGRYTQQIATRLTVADRSELDLPGYDHPRQPHDVLAWLNDRLDSANNSLDVAILVATSRASTASKITAYNGIIERQPGWDFIAPDPHAATFALAQAIMEAQR